MSAGTQARGTGILALHGFAASAAVWQPLSERIRTPVRFTAPDLPGHGGAPGLSSALTLDALAEICAASVASPAIWLGWSLGGLVALYAARCFPQKVAGVVAVAISPRFLIAPGWPNAVEPDDFFNFQNALTQDHDQALERFYALQSHTRRGASRTLARRLRGLALERGAPRPGVLEETLAILGNTDLRDVAAALSCPVMAVLGEDDLLVPSAVSEDLARLNPAWRIEVMEAAGHVPFLSHPGAFGTLLDSFVQTVTDARGAA